MCSDRENSVLSLFRKGCEGDFRCKEKLNVHVFHDTGTGNKLSQVRSKVRKQGMNIRLHPTTFQTVVTSNRVVWGYTETDIFRAKLALASNYFRYYLPKIMYENFNARSFLYLDTDSLIVGSNLGQIFRPPLPLANFGEQDIKSCTAAKILLLNDVRLKPYDIKPDDVCLAAAVMLVNVSHPVDGRIGYRRT
jgi:hypothetical protein